MRKIIAALSLVLSAHQLHAQAVAAVGVAQGDLSQVVAKRGGVELTVQDFDTILQSALPNQRAGLVQSGDRVHQLIDSELLAKQGVLYAKAKGWDQDPVAKRIMARAVEQALMEITVKRVVAEAPKQNFELLAKENYIANPENFVVPETFVVQHVLVSSETRSEKELTARASEVLTKAKAKADFDALVEEYSDDPSKVNNKGVMRVATPGEFVPAFEEAAKALQKPGDISPLVKTEYGLHVLKLVAREPSSTKPFEEVRAQLVAEAENNYLESVRKKFFSDLRSANPQFDGAAIDGLKNLYGTPQLANGDAAAGQ